MSIYKGSTLLAATNLASLTYSDGKLKLENSVGGSYEVEPDTAATEDSKNLVTSDAVWRAVQRSATAVDAEAPLKVSLVPAGTWIYTQASAYDSETTYYGKSGGGYVLLTIPDEYVFDTDFYVEDGGTYTHVTADDTFSAAETYYTEDSGSYTVAENQPTAQTWFREKYVREQSSTNTYTVKADVDSEPTESSGNLVTSGGVWQAILEASPSIEGAAPVTVTAETDPDTGVVTNTVSVEVDSEPTAGSEKLLTSGVLKDELDRVDLSVTGEAPISVQTTSKGGWAYTEASTYDSTATYFLKSRSTYEEVAIADEYVFDTDFYVYIAADDVYEPVTISMSYDTSETYYTYSEDTSEYGVAVNPPTAQTWFATKYTRAPAEKPTAVVSIDDSAYQRKQLDTPLEIDGTSVVTVEGALGALNEKTVEVDDELSTTSENPVQNKVVTSAVSSRLLVVDAMPAIPTDGQTVLYVGTTTTELTQGGIYLYSGTAWTLISTAEVDLSAYSKNLIAEKQSDIAAAQIEEYDTFDTYDEAGDGAMVFGDVAKGDKNPVSGGDVYAAIPKIYTLTGYDGDGTRTLTLPKGQYVGCIIRHTGSGVGGASVTSGALGSARSGNGWNISAGFSQEAAKLVIQSVNSDGSAVIAFTVAAGQSFSTLSLIALS